MYLESSNNFVRKIALVSARIGLSLKLSMTFFLLLQTGLLFAGESQETYGDDPVGKRELLLSQLSELESLGHKNDLAIIESLIDLSDSSVALQLFGEASEFLNRALQIERQSSGSVSYTHLTLPTKA